MRVSTRTYRASKPQTRASLPDQDHLLLKLPLRVQLRADLVVEIEKLLERLRLGRHDEADDVHQQLRHGVAVEHDGQDALHGLDLGVVGALLKLGLDIGERRDVRIVLVDHAVRILEEGRHGGPRWVYGPGQKVLVGRVARKRRAESLGSRRVSGSFDLKGGRREEGGFPLDLVQLPSAQVGPRRDDDEFYTCTGERLVSTRLAGLRKCASPGCRR